jgi:23S rRNA (cytosine1962-C5)-methyltransferase
MKCERFGSVVVSRPDPLALWSPAAPQVWERATARFEQRGEEGSWQATRQPAEDWSVSWESLKFGLRLASFKHTGVFPEQASNWKHLRDSLSAGDQVLNLFGYTGGATLAALSAGASVVHVDASRPAIASAKNNAALSGLADRPVRWMEDDAVKFVEREVRRERLYDSIVMDPPAFGRGPNRELWRFESDLTPLLRSCRKILKPGGRLLINAYSMGFPAIAVEQAAREVWPEARSVESVELTLKESSARGFLLPAGITVRLVV